MEFSNNGQVLLVSTSNGQLLGYSTGVPLVFSEYQQLAAVTTSFNEVQVFNLEVLLLSRTTTPSPSSRAKSNLLTFQ